MQLGTVRGACCLSGLHHSVALRVVSCFEAGVVWTDVYIRVAALRWIDGLPQSCLPLLIIIYSYFFSSLVLLHTTTTHYAIYNSQTLLRYTAQHLSHHAIHRSQTLPRNTSQDRAGTGRIFRHLRVRSQPPRPGPPDPQTQQVRQVRPHPGLLAQPHHEEEEEPGRELRAQRHPQHARPQARAPRPRQRPLPRLPHPRHHPLLRLRPAPPPAAGPGRRPVQPHPPRDLRRVRHRARAQPHRPREGQRHPLQAVHLPPGRPRRLLQARHRVQPQALRLRLPLHLQVQGPLRLCRVGPAAQGDTPGRHHCRDAAAHAEGRRGVCQHHPRAAQDGYLSFPRRPRGRVPTAVRQR